MRSLKDICCICVRRDEKLVKFDNLNDGLIGHYEKIVNEKLKLNEISRYVCFHCIQKLKNSLTFWNLCNINKNFLDSKGIREQNIQNNHPKEHTDNGNTENENDYIIEESGAQLVDQLFLKCEPIKNSEAPNLPLPFEINHAPSQSSDSSNRSPLPYKPPSLLLRQLTSSPQAPPIVSNATNQKPVLLIQLNAPPLNTRLETSLLPSVERTRNETTSVLLDRLNAPPQVDVNEPLILDRISAPVILDAPDLDQSNFIGIQQDDYNEYTEDSGTAGEDMISLDALAKYTNIPSMSSTHNTTEVIDYSRREVFDIEFVGVPQKIPKMEPL